MEAATMQGAYYCFAFHCGRHFFFVAGVQGNPEDYPAVQLPQTLMLKFMVSVSRPICYCSTTVEHCIGGTTESTTEEVQA